MDNAHQLTRVRTICPETLCRTAGIEQCALVKIDVTGAELPVLQALTPLIEAHRPHLFIEHCRKLWDRFDARVEDALALLRPMDYDIYFIRHNLTRPFEGQIPDPCNVVCVPRGRPVHLA
jgi:hypothetical protein